jgi:hypothetical protein
MKPAATDSTLTVVGRVIAIAYPAADVLLLALLAYVLFGAAALHPSMAALSQRAAERPQRLARRRLSLLTGVSLVAPILLLGQSWGRDGIDAAPIGIGSIALFLLLVGRMAGLSARSNWRPPNSRSWPSGTRSPGRQPPGVGPHPAGGDGPALRAGNPVGVALLDLDHFKQFNDRTATRPATSSSRGPPRPVAVAAALKRPAGPLRRGGVRGPAPELDPQPSRPDHRPAPADNAAGADLLGRRGPVESA